jgi:alpha-tubulin suppressor-like RCC1 family protein
MRAKHILWRSSLFFFLLIILEALAGTPGRAQPQPHNVAPNHGPVIPDMISIFFGGPGSGTVSMRARNLVQIDCTSDCTKTVGSISLPTEVTLTAAPASGSSFFGWGGACSARTPACTLTLSRATRVIAYFGSAFRMVSAGQSHTCALRPTGTVTCWGRNDDGELGTGSTNSSVTIGTATGIAGAVAIAAGSSHTCALIVGGSVMCWGVNSYGQVGTWTFGADVGRPTAVPGITDAVAVTAGGFHSCVIHAGGTASCWGANNHGQLGDGTTSYSSGPVAVNLAVAGPLSRIAAGGFHTCGIIAANSRVVCWGANNVGELGIASRADTATPAVMVVTGGDPGCAGTITPGCTHPATPAPIMALTMVKAIAASNGGGQEFHSVALDASGLDWGWGNNNDGEINPTIGGEQDAGQRGIIPAPTSTFTKIAAGAAHTCILSPSIGIFCRGDNHFGQSGPTPNLITPAAAVPLTAGAVEVAAGALHTCAVTPAPPFGTIMCWGDNDNGQATSMPTPTTIVPLPVTVPLP